MSLFKKIKNFVLFILLISFSMSQPTQATQFNYYADLAGDWSEIFPDQNRNAAGPKFFKHILGKKNYLPRLFWNITNYIVQFLVH